MNISIMIGLRVQEDDIGIITGIQSPTIPSEFQGTPVLPFFSTCIQAEHLGKRVPFLLRGYWGT